MAMVGFVVMQFLGEVSGWVKNGKDFLMYCNGYYLNAKGQLTKLSVWYHQPGTGGKWQQGEGPV